MKEERQEIRFVENKRSKLVVHVTAELEMKFRELFILESDNEISGILFYKVIKMDDNFSDISLQAFDFLLMDIGSPTHSNFDYSDKISWYIMDKGYDDSVYYGICHSHPRFSTMASGTDMNTIREEGDDRVHFLSMIINVFGEYNAWFTRKLHVEKSGECSIKCTTFNGREIKASRPINDSYDMVEYVHGKVIIDKPKEKSETRMIFDLVKKEIDKKKADEFARMNCTQGLFGIQDGVSIPKTSASGLTYEQSLVIRSLFVCKDTEDIPVSLKDINKPNVKMQDDEELIDLIEDELTYKQICFLASNKRLKFNTKVLGALYHAVALKKKIKGNGDI